MSFLNNLSKSTKIGINISSKSIIEIVEFDVEKNKVLKYACKDLNYNVSSRRIENTHELESTVKALFEETKIKPNCSAILTVPSVLMGHQTVPTILDDDSIKMALTSEAERSYLFKKQEPAIGWQEINVNEINETKFIAYSAVPKEDIENIEKVFNNIGTKIIAIDNAYTALIRGLIISGKVQENILEDKNWNILVVTQNSYVILHLMGNKLIEIMEDPIAIKSFNHEEIYPTIASASKSNLMNFPGEQLLIVSESNDVSAEALASYMDMPCTVTSVENNKYTKEPPAECDLNVLPSKVNMISTSVIGTANWKCIDAPLNFNLSGSEVASESYGSELVIMGHVIDVTPQLFKNFLLCVIVGIVGLLASLYFIFSAINGNFTKIYQGMSIEMSRLEKNIQSRKDSKIGPSLNKIAKERYESNKATLKSYNAITVDIPEKLWLEEFQIDENQNTYVKGKSYNVNDIISFFQSLNKLGKYNNLRITSLKVTGSDTSLLNTDEEEVQITANNNTDGLPSVPELPTLYDEKYYEFTFGVPLNNTEETISNKQGNNNNRRKRR